MEISNQRRFSGDRKVASHVTVSVHGENHPVLYRVRRQKQDAFFGNLEIQEAGKVVEYFIKHHT